MPTIDEVEKLYKSEHLIKIADSGERRKFESGAVRDIAEGKGRCDLLPLGIIGNMLHSEILSGIENYIRSGDTHYLYEVVKDFSADQFGSYYSALLEVAKHYEDGASKYDERNWEKGIPLHCYIDSGVRHYLKYRRGDEDERHDRAFLWNMLGAIWTHTNLPEMVDLPFKEGSPNETI